MMMIGKGGMQLAKLGKAHVENAFRLRVGYQATTTMSISVPYTVQ